MIEDRAQEAAEMAEAFLFVRDLFEPPCCNQWARLHSEETRAAWTAMADRLGVSRTLDLPSDAAAYESAFIAAFDAGAPRPLVPVFESHYNKREPVPRILHENVLFHQSFGLRLRHAGSETSDHLRHQLEFIGRLYHMEAEELGGRCDPEILAQIRAGRRDFLDRHLLSWLPEAFDLARKAPGGFRWVASLVSMALNLTVLALRDATADSSAEGRRVRDADSGRRLNR